MGLVRSHIPFSFSVFCLFPLLLSGQSHEKDRILRDYFPGNEARDQAVITARYAEAAHRFAYELIEGDPSDRDRRKRLLYSDTARAFILHARYRVDSTVRYAADSSRLALRLMQRARKVLREGQAFLKAYRDASSESRRFELAKKALNRTADASVDAFHASMLLRSPGSGKGQQKDENLYDLMKGTEPPDRSSYEQEAERLQVDRKSFRTLRDRYAKKLQQKEKEIEEARNKGASQERIDSLKADKELLALKKKDAAGRVKSIDEMLRKKLLEHIGVDSSKSGANVFQVDRWGYYEDRSIPIDAEQPDGILFRVQIGYYSKGNRPEKRLEGLYPIWGERVSDQYVRYCVGRFSQYEQANKAKRYLRKKKDLNDAFIVAYKDGKKIPVVEAIKDKKKE